MSRTITAAANNQATADQLTIITLAELSFASGYVRAHTGVGDIIFNGNTFLGVGAYGGISGVREGSNLEAEKITATLTGVDPAFISLALNEQYQGRSASFWIGFLNAAGQLIANPVLVFGGRIDTMNIQLGNKGTVTVSVINKLADWAKPKVRRYNDADQQARFPGDLGLQYVERAAERTLFWGRRSQ